MIRPFNTRQRHLFDHKAYIPLRHKTGTGVGLDPQRLTFALPNAKDTSNMLVSFALGDAKPQRESVEYRLRWVPNAKSLRWPCTFHVFCVDFICVWCPTQTQIPVEYMGLRLIKLITTRADLYFGDIPYLMAMKISLFIQANNLEKKNCFSTTAPPGYH